MAVATVAIHAHKGLIGNGYLRRDVSVQYVGLTETICFDRGNLLIRFCGHVGDRYISRNAIMIMLEMQIFIPARRADI
jgi:hypothetical protein